MPEPTIDDYKIRLILQKAWKSKTRVNETLKTIKEKLDGSLITSINVQEWFDEFDKGNTSIFNEKSPLNIKIEKCSFDPLNSLLFLSDEKCDIVKLIKCDDRFVEYSYRSEFKWSIIRHDLFLSEKKEIKLPSDAWVFEMIDDGFLLEFNECKIRLFKLDYENSSINSLDSIELDSNGMLILVDQLNPSKFVIFMVNRKFMMGEIGNEKIVLSNSKNYGYIIHCFGKRLLDNKIQEFNRNQMGLLEFCELNLNTMESSEIDVSIDFGDESLSIKNSDPYPCCWSKNRFYGIFRMSDKQSHMFMFNLDVMKWSNVQIVANYSENLFIDSNENLTLCVKGYHKVNAYYRFNLRNPEKLKNLAHLFVSKQSTLFGEKKYLECVKKLFINS